MEKRRNVPFSVLSILLLIVALSVGKSRADLLDCDEKIFPNLAIIEKVDYEDKPSNTNAVANLFKKWGCEIKKGATKLEEEVKQRAEKLKEKVQDLSSKLESIFHTFKDQLTKDSAESLEENDKFDPSFVIDADVLKSDALHAGFNIKCGHGQLLDILGHCLYSSKK